MDLLVLAVAFVVILLGAELFTNGIEWFGRKLELAEGAVGSVLAAVGTALPETMIPIIAILFAGGRRRHGRGRHRARSWAPRSCSRRSRCSSPASACWPSGGAGATGTPDAVDTSVLVHDIRYFVVAYALAIGAAFLPPELALGKLVVAVALLAIYAWYVKGHFEADPEVDAADLAPLRFHRLRPPRPPRTIPAVPRLRIVGVQVVAALACIVGGRLPVRRRGGPPRGGARRQRDPARARHRPDRDRAAREVQLADLGPPGQGHPGDGQHHGCHGLPVGDPDRGRARVRRRQLAGDGGLDARLRRAPGSRSSRWRAVFLPMWRRARLDGRALLVGGVFYLVYLALVGLRRSRGRPDRRLTPGSGLPPARRGAPSAGEGARASRARLGRPIEASRAARRRTRPGADHADAAAVRLRGARDGARPAPLGRGPDRLLRGRLRPAPGREGQHHDPRVHVRDRHLRGHPRLLERGAGDAVRRCSSASTRSASATARRCC